MSGLVRQLKKASQPAPRRVRDIVSRDYSYDPDMAEYGVPSGFTANMRSDDARKAAGMQAIRRAAQFRDLAKEFSRSDVSLSRKKEIIKELVADVNRVVTEADPSRPGSDPVIVADVAAGLAALGKTDMALLDAVLRRTGNPELFEPLRGAELPEPPRGAIGNEAAKKLAEERAKKPERFSQNQVPMVARRASAMVDPAYQKTRKNRSTGEQEPVFDDDGKPVVVPKSQTSKNYKLRPNTLYTIAGDQLAQIRAIKEKGLQPTLPRVVRGKNEVPDGGQFDQDITDPALIPDDEEFVQISPQDAVLNVGTRQGTGFTGDDVARWGKSGVSVDQMVEQRNIDYRDRLVNELYRVSGRADSELAPSQVTDYFRTNPNTGELSSASITQKGWALSDDQLAGWLDSWVPEWRAGFPMVQRDGSITYPDKAPSARFLSNLIWSLTEVNDPQFATRIEPFIQKAIDAAPPAPDPNARAKSGARNAVWYSKHAFLPGGDFVKRGGAAAGPNPKNPDYQFSIYDDRLAPKQIERETPLQVPEEPFGKEAIAAIPEPEALPEADSLLAEYFGGSTADSAGAEIDADALLREFDPAATAENPASAEVDTNYNTTEKDLLQEFFGGGQDEIDTDSMLRDFEQGQPGMDDQAAIYRKRPQSPLKSLLA